MSSAVALFMSPAPKDCGIDTRIWRFRREKVSLLPADVQEKGLTPKARAAQLTPSAAKPIISPPMLRYTTAGESHGKCLITSIEGLPYGTPLDPGAINLELSRRQGGYGRGA